MSFLSYFREIRSVVLTIVPGLAHVGILTWTIISAGLAVKKFVSIPPGSRNAAKTTTAENVKVRKEGLEKILCPLQAPVFILRALLVV